MALPDTTPNPLDDIKVPCRKCGEVITTLSEAMAKIYTQGKTPSGCRICRTCRDSEEADDVG